MGRTEALAEAVDGLRSTVEQQGETLMTNGVQDAVLNPAGKIEYDYANH